MRQSITRRDSLKAIAATAIFAPAVFGAATRGGAASLPKLPGLSASEALLLLPDDRNFERYQPAFNSRTMLRPQLRALCRTAKSVGAMVDWCRNNDLSFALRSGGHCFEGLSQSSSVVIDTRMLDQVAIDAATKTAVVGSGASLGSVYLKAGALGFALSAGSCPTIGVCGHVLGGGYGYLARPLGLACDSLLSIDLIDPQGKQIHADSQENSDLFWACRGGGGGSFGAATGFRLQMHAISNVLVFHIAWRRLSPERAVTIMADWQAWAPKAPSSITATFVVIRDPRGGLRLQCSGQSIGSVQELRRELKVLSSSPTILPMSYLAAVKLLAGSIGFRYTSAPMKGKSDYVSSP
jgi:FAD/FMN-containing dehydrogenase